MHQRLQSLEEQRDLLLFKFNEADNLAYKRGRGFKGVVKINNELQAVDEMIEKLKDEMDRRVPRGALFSNVFRQNRKRILSYEDGTTPLIEEIIENQEMVISSYESIKNFIRPRLRKMINEYKDYVVRTRHQEEDKNNLYNNIYQFRSYMYDEVQEINNYLNELNRQYKILKSSLGVSSLLKVKQYINKIRVQRKMKKFDNKYYIRINDML
jgi:hypothetical protein